MRSVYAQSVGILVVGACLGCAPMLPSSSSVLTAEGFRLVLEEASFDGHSLRGRLLIGGVKGRRAVPAEWAYSAFAVQDVVRCETRTRLVYPTCWSGAIDGSVPPVRILLEPGEWYGRSIDARILDTEKPAEQCVLVAARLLLAVRGEPVPGKDVNMPFTIRAERGGRVTLVK